MLQPLRLVHTSVANANASGSTSKHTCKLPQRKCKLVQTQKMESFHFLVLAYALAFVFHTCEQGQRKCKCQRKGERKKWKGFLFLALVYALAFVFHTCEPGQRKRQRKKWKDFISLRLHLHLRLYFTRVNRGNANANAKNGKFSFPCASIYTCVCISHV